MQTPQAMPAQSLTPVLSSAQIKQNIDALRAQNIPTATIQSYVNNYQANPDGSYSLKGMKAPTVAPEPVPGATAPAPADGTTQEASGTGESTAPVDNGFLSFIKNAGNDIGQALDSGQAAKTVAANTAQHSQDIQTLSERAQQMKAAGQDTTHIDNMIRTMLSDSPSQYGGNLTDIIPVASKSNEQIVGDMGSLATGLITAGSGLSPAMAGAAFGLTHALSQNKGVGGTLVDTAIGALGGKITQLGFNAAAPFVQKAVEAYGQPLLDKLSSYIPDAAMPALQKIADAATTVLDTANTAQSKVSDALDTAAGSSALGTDVNDAAANAADAAKAKIQGTPEEVAAKQTAAQHQTNVDALNPDLSGKAKIDAYKQVATQGRGVTEGSVFGDQSLSPAKQTVNLAQRLGNDMPLSDGSVAPAIKLDASDHVGNLKALGDALNQTEGQLQTALKADPEIEYTLDKPTLQTTLNDLKTNAPTEFIKDPTKSAAYNAVVDYGQKVIDDAPDTIQGGRDARIAFDNQAQKEFPSAFKDDGTIDTKTPAGAAIKATRDAINQHIYDTAPAGSDIKALIGREADIFKAVNNIAPKAAKNDGANSVTQWIKNNPKVSKVVGTALKLTGLGYIGSKVL